MKTLLLSFALLLSLGAFAQEENVAAVNDGTVGEALPAINMPEEVTIKSGDTKIIPLAHFFYLDRLTLEVKNNLLCGKDSVRISFDGYNSQNLAVEGGTSGWRTKIVVVNANARNIEIYNSSNCKIKVKDITILPRRYGTRPGHGPAYYPATEAAAQVSYLMETFLYLDQLIGDADRVAVLSPAKKIIGKAMATLNTSPETSQAALKAIQDVVAFLKANEAFIDRLSSTEATFDIANEIQSVKVSLERMIR
jgi:hypothetical protein